MPARKSIWMMLSICLLTGLLAAACSTAAIPVETLAPPTDTPHLRVEGSEATATPAEEVPQEEGDENKIRFTPTPAPTATPGPLTLAIDRFASSTGADRVQIWGITLEDWLNTLLSILIFLVIVLLVLRVLRWLLRRVTALTHDETDNQLLEMFWPQASWVVGILALSFATSRLTYFGPDIQQSLDQVFESLVIISLAVASLKLVNYVVTHYKEKVEPQHDERQPDHVVVLIQRTLRLSIVVVTIVMLLSIYNINVDALIAALGIGGLAISLAAKDSLSNMISGLILMLDKPFRVGDRIEVIGAGTWGDVIDIGLRSTQIRTEDNRMVFIPNSTISTDRVINYSFRDPSLRGEIDFAVGYGPDIETVRKIVIEAVQQIEGIQRDKPIEALYIKMGDTGRILRVRWWYPSYTEKWKMIDRVHSEVQNALNEQGIDIPYNISFRTDRP